MTWLRCWGKPSPSPTNGGLALFLERAPGRLGGLLIDEAAHAFAREAASAHRRIHAAVVTDRDDGGDAGLRQKADVGPAQARAARMIVDEHDVRAGLVEARHQLRRDGHGEVGADDLSDELTRGRHRDQPLLARVASIHPEGDQPARRAVTGQVQRLQEAPQPPSTRLDLDRPGDGQQNGQQRYFERSEASSRARHVLRLLDRWDTCLSGEARYGARPPHRPGSGGRP